jgi:hypothetical protein
MPPNFLSGTSEYLDFLANIFRCTCVFSGNLGSHMYTDNKLLYEKVMLLLKTTQS